MIGAPATINQYCVVDLDYMGPAKFLIAERLGPLPTKGGKIHANSRDDVSYTLYQA